ncbi:hypothetical protein ACHAW6_012596 [Cyclotella cf. meneghiniana]
MRMALPSNHENTNGLSNKLPGLVIALLHMALNIGRKRLAQSYTWTIHMFQLTFAYLLAVSTTNMICGQVTHDMNSITNCSGMNKNQPIMQIEIRLLMAADALSDFTDHKK